MERVVFVSVSSAVNESEASSVEELRWTVRVGFFVSVGYLECVLPVRVAVTIVDTDRERDAVGAIDSDGGSTSESVSEKDDVPVTSFDSFLVRVATREVLNVRCSERVSVNCSLPVTVSVDVE